MPIIPAGKRKAALLLLAYAALGGNRSLETVHAMLKKAEEIAKQKVT